MLHSWVDFLDHNRANPLWSRHRRGCMMETTGLPARTKELNAMDMMGLAIAIGCIVLVTVIMGLIATHGCYQKPHH